MSEVIVLERLLGTAINDGLYDLASLKRQRVYIFFTRQGFLFTALLGVMLLGAVNYNNSMAYILTFLLASLLMVCMLHTYRNLRGLILESATAAPVFAGETARFPIIIDNRSGDFRVSLSVKPYPRGRSRKKQGNNNVNCNIAAAEIQRIYIPVQSKKRGLLSPGRLRISSTYPLGLFQAWSYMPVDKHCLVYPRPAGISELPQQLEYQAEDQTGNRTGTDDFVGFRHYHAGDSIRNIDWKALARERGLLFKRFSGSGASKLMLHWGQVSHLHNDEARLSQLCQWILHAEVRGYHYGLEIPDSFIDIACGEQHKHRCLEKLARYGIIN